MYGKARGMLLFGFSFLGHRTSARTCTCTQRCACVYVWIYIYVCMYMCVCVCVCVYVWMYMYVCVCTVCFCVSHLYGTIASNKSLLYSTVCMHCKCMCMYLYIYVCIGVCVAVCMYIFSRSNGIVVACWIILRGVLCSILILTMIKLLWCTL